MTTLVMENLESWRSVVGMAAYEVSSFGRVRSLDRVIIRNGFPASIKGRILKGYSNEDGYLKVGLAMNGMVYTKLIHHLVLEAFSIEIRGNRQVRHLNGKRDDNRLSNLRWGTIIENDADKDLHGTRPCGASHGMSKLSAEDKSRIREACLYGARKVDLAAIYAVHPATIFNIARS